MSNIVLFHIKASSFTWVVLLELVMYALRLVLFLLWSLVEVHSQTEYPYVSFMGENLPNHSYVDLTLVGTVTNDPGNIVRCITGLSSCCTANQGVHLGDWYFPDGDSLPLRSPGIDIFERRGPQQVGTMPRHHLVYIIVRFQPVNDDNDLSVGETVYVGLYASGGNELINGVYNYVLSYGGNYLG